MQMFSMEIYGEISMEIDVLILHGIPWNSMEVFHTGLARRKYKDAQVSSHVCNIVNY